MATDGFPFVPLGPLCAKIGSGATPRGGEKVYLPSGEVSFIRSQNVRNDRFAREGLVYLAAEHADQLENVTVEPGDVLLNITGDSVARCCQVDPHVLPARVNQHVAIIRTKAKELDSRFLRYFMVTPRMQAQMSAWAHAGGTRQALTKGMIEAFEVPKPEMSIQKRIAHVLGTFDDRINVNRRIIRTLEAMAAAVFKSWFIAFDPVHAKLNGSDSGLPSQLAAMFPGELVDSPLGMVPVGWKARPLGDVLDVNPFRPLTKRRAAPYLDMANMPTRGPSPEHWIMREVGSGARFRNGDTLLARITPCLENGKTAYVDFLTDGEVGWGSTEYIVLRPKGAIPPVFAYLLARTGDFRSFAINQMTGSSGRQRVPPDSLSKYHVVTPEITSPIMREFGLIVTPLFDRIKIAMNQNRRLAGLRDALLPKLLSGELELSEAIDAAEEATA